MPRGGHLVWFLRQPLVIGVILFLLILALLWPSSTDDDEDDDENDDVEPAVVGETAAREHETVLDPEDALLASWIGHGDGVVITPELMADAEAWVDAQLASMSTTQAPRADALV